VGRGGLSVVGTLREVRFYGSRAFLTLTFSRRGVSLTDISIPEIGAEFVYDATRARWQLFREEVPVKTGRLRDSMQFQTSGLSGEIRFGASYWIFVAMGTRPHIIRPVRARVLRFEVRGQVVFAMRVRHPGTRPSPFIRRADERLARRIPDIFNRIWERQMRELER